MINNNCCMHADVYCTTTWPGGGGGGSAGMGSVPGMPDITKLLQDPEILSAFQVSTHTSVSATHF